MDPVASIVSSIAPPSTFGPSAVATAVPLLADILLSPLAAGGVGVSAIVELSGLGQTLSALSAFQAGLPQAGAGDLNAVEAEAQALVDSFDAIAGRLADIVTATGEPLSAQLAGELAAAVQATFDNGASSLTQLSQIGIIFEPAASGIGGTLILDTARLQAAFAADGAGTRSLLAGALAALSGLATSYAGPGGTVPAAMAADEQLAALSPLISGAATSGVAPTMADLLLFESVGQPLGVSAQQLLAIEEFNLVESLLGSTAPTLP